MKLQGGGAVFALFLLLLSAAAAQSVFAAHAYRFGGQPDFILTAVLAASLLSNASTGCLLGLCGGLLTSALVGETVGTFLVTRTLAGFVAGWFPARMFRGNLLVVVLSVVVASIVTEALYILAAPRVGLQAWFWAALVGTGWNALLAIPTTFLLRTLGWGEDEI